MKRIHLFEFEDLPWIPGILRDSLTRMVDVLHRLLKTSDALTEILNKALLATGEKVIIDLGAGSGAVIMRSYNKLSSDHQFGEVRLVLTDLYPDKQMVDYVSRIGNKQISYHTSPIDASQVPADMAGIRTMIASFHHMSPTLARKILENASKTKQPLCILEISDNSQPKGLWWLAIPVNIISSLIISILVRPLTWQQVVFTYLVPIIPIMYAWDGAVSNARTYTLEDMDILLNGLESKDYTWEKGTVGWGFRKLYLLGLPKR
jgi:hypothetical protein